jgi:DNA-binding MarR family transcriptional regulator
VTVLVTRPEATFSDLKELLGLTQGNLGIHLGKLEEAGYVSIAKEFVKRKPRTTVRITPVGRKAFLSHVDRLASVARQING